MASDWVCVPRLYEVTKNQLQSYQTYEHPLKLPTVTMVESKGTRPSSMGSNTSSRSSSMSILAEPLLQTLDGIDPLTQFAKQEEELMDPLSQMASEYESFKKIKANKREKDILADESLNWNSKRLTILNKFTTSEKLSISTSFLTTSTQTHPGTDATFKQTVKVQTVVSDKVRFRLEQLDDFEDGSMRHMMDLTQQEYIQRIEQLNQELVQSWHNDQRVKALKIAIQCSKILADTSVLPFYPSQFVLITDILDIFGKLVYERLKQKTLSGPDSMRAVNVASARDTCLNWFFKIASIRELLPRLYVEIAILKCYEFLNESYDDALQRLTQMIRGIGDPLVATYARCYLVRVGVLVTTNKTYIHNNFKDFLSVYQTAFSGAIRSELNRQRVDMSVYLSLYGPALNFILQALVHKNNLYTEDILKDVQNVKNNGTILMAILQAFQPEFIASNAFDFVNVLTSSNTEGISKSQLFKTLGSSMSSCNPLFEQRNAFLVEAFKTINTFTDPSEYITCVESWAQFIASNFPVTELNRFLGEIHSRIAATKVGEKHHQQLRNILDKVLQHQKNIELLLVQENFLPFLDLFQKESSKVEAGKYILDIYKRNGKEFTYDAVVINALMYVGKILNDSVNALTVEDERRQISQLICHFIRKVYYGRDFEKQLSFYVEARGSFSNLDAVYNTLVQSVNKLAMETCQIVQNQHSRKTQGFVKACIAFCFITIPSITSVQQQMDLYLLTGQVALVNQCLGQADACFEEALNLVAQLPNSIEIDGKTKCMDSYLVSYLSNMLATLVLVPDSPERGVLYLLNLLLEVVQKYPFALNTAGPTQIYLNALDMLYVQNLEEFPYHIPQVVSNDELYGHDPKFLAEVNNICRFVVEEILRQLSILGSSQQFKLQATLSLELFLRIVRYADLSKEQTFQLALNLWFLATKHESHLEPKYMPRILKSLEDLYKLLKDTKSKDANYLKELLLRLHGK
ncbi:VPS35 endosomal protein sorting factor-like isoform X1 [Lucilia cuprina]|uniref:VPS35 endosomal protein sorting factor-like isoform X1 n=1 Tax=Lucilia cuprina TaxID=7375 RepID=UPI001F05B99C|nr:VPS35 endosomal protein sorting factor-like isoform X1 [Lucilia cuprina]